MKIHQLSEYCKSIKIDCDICKRKDECNEMSDEINDMSPAMLIDEVSVHAHWIFDHMDSEHEVVRCSNCGKKMFAEDDCIASGSYCPWCGAIMDESVKE